MRKRLVSLGLVILFMTALAPMFNRGISTVSALDVCPLPHEINNPFCRPSIPEQLELPTEIERVRGCVLVVLGEDRWVCIPIPTL